MSLIARTLKRIPRPSGRVLAISAVVLAIGFAAVILSGFLADRKAANIAQRLLSDDESVRRQALAEVRPANLDRVIGHLFDSAGTTEVAFRGSIRALSEIGEPAADRLIDALHNQGGAPWPGFPEPELTGRTFRLFGWSWFVGKHLTARDVRIRIGAAEALCRVSDPVKAVRAVDAARWWGCVYYMPVEQWTQDAASQLREDIPAALAARGEGMIGPLLSELRHAPQPGEATSTDPLVDGVPVACEALIRLCRRGYTAKVLENIADKRLTLQLVGIAVDARDERAISILSRFLSDPRLKYFAATAIHKIGGPQAASVLERFDSDNGVQGALVDYRAIIARNSSDDEYLLQYILERYGTRELAEDFADRGYNRSTHNPSARRIGVVWLANHRIMYKDPQERFPQGSLSTDSSGSSRE